MECCVPIRQLDHRHKVSSCTHEHFQLLVRRYAELYFYGLREKIERCGMIKIKDIFYLWLNPQSTSSDHYARNTYEEWVQNKLLTFKSQLDCLCRMYLTVLEQ